MAEKVTIGNAELWHGDCAARAPTEVIVELNFPNGTSSRTAYPIERTMDAMVQIAGYLAERKAFTVSYE